MKKSQDKFLKYLRQYFTVHLPTQKQSSPHTITACRQTWNMFLADVVKTQNTALEKLTFENINQEVVFAFLAKMQKERNWSKATYNQRLSCIRSFYKYAAEAEPLLAIYKQDMKGVHLLKMPRIKPVSYMSETAVKALLEQPDASTRTGIRDLFFMVLMFDTAARCSELLGMTLDDFNTANKFIRVIGKGSKLRLIPINDDTIEHFEKYSHVFHPQLIKEQPLFYTTHRQTLEPMSNDNVARFMKEYGIAARDFCKEVPENVHPHQLRHSRAMSLYRKGMPLSLLSEWLGHEDPETTMIYAYADTEMKREAIEKASCNSTVVNALPVERIWEGNEDLIQRLCGLN